MEDPDREPAEHARSEEALVLRAVRQALVGAAGDLSEDAVLQQLVDTALELVGARYAALGVPDGEGGFARFITAGMDDELIEAMGPLPRTHGLLGAMLTSPSPYRVPDVRQDPRFRGWWPRQHPEMRSFLGYPVVFKGEIVAAFYLTDKLGAPAFSNRDERLVGDFVPHAAVLVELARLHDASRDLSIAGERERIARELHDALTQTLFGTRLALRTASAALQEGPVEPAAALDQLDRASGLLDSAFDELKAMIWDLQPPDLEVDGLAGVIRKRLALLARTSDLEVDLQLDKLDQLDGAALEPETEHQLLRILQEALTNIVRHAEASQLAVAVTTDEPPGGTGQPSQPGLLHLVIHDNGTGFDPDQQAIRSRRLGLTSMSERAQAISGRLTIESGPGQGTTVRVEVPLG